MASSPSSLSPHFSFPNQFMMNSSFSDLLTKDDESVKQGLLFNEQIEFGFKSKFKSNSPPSLPIGGCPSPSFFNFPSGFLDSPVLLSSNNYLLPSPTTGAFPAQEQFNWMGSSNSSNNYQKEIKQEEEKKITDFSFRPSVTDTPLQSGDSESDYKHYPHQPIQTLREQKRSEDGYNWRKYGQKQVKGSEDPRSYYKCTYQNCPMKKKVEISFDGKVTDVVYKPSKDSHNHPKPQPSKKSLASAASQLVQQPSVSSNSYSQTVSVSTQDNNSSTSVDDDEFDNTSLKRSKSGTTGDLDESEPKSKKWKNEGENEVLSGYGNSRVVKEPKVVVQTTSDIDILDDGFRWRKYGQKVVKGNPNPRSYYKCTSLGCAVRKHVERAANNIRSVITTYEGKHNHDIPAARGSYRHSSNNNTSSSITNVAMSTSSNEQVPYTLEMMQNSENYEYGSYMNQQHNLENTFSETKSEPMKDDVLLELLY
ncbi:hypothetical protein C5167_045275 [Papaver somniferum]|uniref:WRKY domain-containing protein n=1 Tax=Papaver somniferum TaxID=3469 RepID=A0A4Y7LAH4_PAPSO|nr:probable WRKY transcription factor 33 [Papaver somniferum]RZC82483.1 hypothetical protein C5167_045275 [Papaver somniferum]